MKDDRLSRRDFLRVSAMTAMLSGLDWTAVGAAIEKIEGKQSRPVVVIGAGLGGLCCGAYLAQQGFPVTVIEQGNKPGGYATAFYRGRFHFDVSLHSSCISNNMTARTLSNLGLLSKLSRVMTPECFCFQSPAFQFCAPPKNPDLYVERLSEQFPEESAGIEGFINKLTVSAEEADRLHKNRRSFIRGLFPFQYSNLWSLRHKTVKNLIEAYIKNPKLADLLGAPWGYYGLAPSELSSFVFAVSFGDYLKNGAYYIHPRSSELAAQLVSAIESAGGTIQLNTRAESIRVQDETVKGVRISGGKELKATAVAANVNTPVLFSELIDRNQVDNRYLNRLDGYRPSISAFVVWLGLNGDITSKVNHYNTYIASGHGAEADYRACIAGDIDQMPFYVTIYNHLFDQYSPPGTTCVTIMALCGYKSWQKFESDYVNGNKSAYHEEKRKWTQTFIRRAETSLIPDLRSGIEESEAATPLTFRRYTGNPNGAIYGYAFTMNNTFLNRIDCPTPVKGLFLAGAWGDPGGRYTGVMRGGELAFEEIIDYFSKF